MNRRSFLRGAAAVVAATALPAVASTHQAQELALDPVLTAVARGQHPRLVVMKGRQAGMSTLVAQSMRERGYQVYEAPGRQIMRDAQTGRDREFELIQLEQLRQQRQVEADDRLQERIRADTRRQSDDFDLIYREIKSRDR